MFIFAVAVKINIKKNMIECAWLTIETCMCAFKKK
jgi:hypothetical protein